MNSKEIAELKADAKAWSLYADVYDAGYEQGKKDAVLHGQWEEKFWTKNDQHVCSLCHKTVRVHPENVPYKFCPYCGGRMDEHENDLWEVGDTNAGNIAMDAQEGESSAD